MTAEVAVMNSHGVALAADSAVTGGKRKVYETANKVFMLSRSEPVGIMIYNQAQFIGIPLETIIKFYRGRIEGKSMDTLAEYGTDFLEFLRSGFDGMVSPTKIENELCGHLFHKCRSILDGLGNRYLYELRELKHGKAAIRSSLKRMIDKRLSDAYAEKSIFTPDFAIPRYLSAFRTRM